VFKPEIQVVIVGPDELAAAGDDVSRLAEIAPAAATPTTIVLRVLCLVLVVIRAPHSDTKPQQQARSEGQPNTRHTKSAAPVRAPAPGTDAPMRR
jgi:hypothetical protein